MLTRVEQPWDAERSGGVPENGDPTVFRYSRHSPFSEVDAVKLPIGYSDIVDHEGADPEEKERQVEVLLSC